MACPRVVIKVLLLGREQEDGRRQRLPDTTILSTPRGKQGSHSEPELQQRWGPFRQLPGRVLHLYPCVLHQAHPER